MTITAPVIRSFRATLSKKDCIDFGLALDNISHMKKSGLSFEKLYRICWNAVLSNQSREIYDILLKKIECCCNMYTENSEFGSILDNWESFVKILNVFSDVSSYLHKNYIEKQHLEDIKTVGNERFGYYVILPKLNGLLHEFDKLVADFMTSGHSKEVLIKIYKMMTIATVEKTIVFSLFKETLFQRQLKYLDQVRKYSTKDFFEAIKVQYIKIKSNCEIIFPKDYTEELLIGIGSFFIQSHTQLLYDQILFTIHMPENIMSFWEISKDHLELKSALITILQKCFDATLLQYSITNKKRQEMIQYCEFVLAVHDYKTKLVSMATHDPLLDSKTTKCFSSHFQTQELSCEAINILLDETLKGKHPYTLDRCLSLFKMFSDKDYFHMYYSLYLAKRLLDMKSVDLNLEMQCLNAFKTTCGSSFVSKLEIMIQDYSMSLELAREYNSNLIDPRILTLASWPYSLENSFPDHIRYMITDFEIFYKSKHPNRQLHWNVNLGMAVINATFDKEYEFHVSTVQMALLMLFNSNVSITYQFIEATFKLQQLELNRHLLPMCISKCKLLLKEPMTKDCLPSDTFKINKEFKHASYRVKVPILHSNTQHVPIREDRTFQIEAVLIRIMKSRKSCSHSLLVSEVLQQLETIFVPDMSAIKYCIGQLIERDFIKRKMDNSDTYDYIS